MQVNRDKSSVKGYKTLLLRVKQLKSKSNASNRIESSVKGCKTLSLRVKQSKSKSITSKWNRIKCKRI